MNFTRLLLLLASLAAPSALVANDKTVLKLWPGKAPGDKGTTGPERVLPARGSKPVIRIADVSAPSITLYPAPEKTATGTTVVICPGGGYSILAWDLEGTEIAEWLNSIGVTAVLLKYRVPRRDKESPHAAPLQDAQRAMRLTRSHAKKWNIDPGRIGMLGFSAGGHLTVMTGTHWDRNTYPKIDAADELSSRPDFLIPIYPAYLSEKTDRTKLRPQIRINSKTPPTFIAVTQDDQTRGVDSALLFIALKRAGVACELHVYSRGGHGYGMRPSGNPVHTWPQRVEQWMRVIGLLKTKDSPLKTAEPLNSGAAK